MIPAPRRIHRPFFAALIALVLLTLDARPPASHVSEAAVPATITTVLYPGWNLVGWVGPSTQTSELFDEIRGLQWASAWDAAAQAYRHATPNGSNALPRVSRGMGIWLWLDEDVPVEWTRPVSEDTVMVWLVVGGNLVAAPATGSFTELGQAVTAAWRWNPARQRFERHDFDADPVNLGDALWLEMSSELGWIQSLAIDPPIVLIGDIPSDVRAEILAEYERMRRFFLERLGVFATGRLHYIGSDADALHDVGRSDGLKLAIPSCSRVSNEVRVSHLRCTHPNHAHSMARDYIGHILVGGLTESGRWPEVMPAQTRGPAWLTYGADQYLWLEYLDANGRVSEAERDARNGIARREATPSSFYEDADTSGFLGWDFKNVLAIFAADWLVASAGETALFDYFHRARFTADWRAAFSAAFGMTVDDFYESFAAHRHRMFPPLPHLTDGRDEAVLIVLDDVPAESAAAARDEFERVRGFFADRFEAEATGFTLYVGQHAEAVLAAAPGWYGDPECRARPAFGLAALALEWCAPSDINKAYLDTYFNGLRRDLAYEQPPSPSGSTQGWAPRWLDQGAFTYADVEYGELVGTLAPGDFRDRAVSTVNASTTSVRTLQLYADEHAAGGRVTRALGYLAVEWLADRAGDPAVFDYYRRLPGATSRDDAFEGAFGLTIEEFYQQFEAYRATLTAE